MTLRELDVHGNTLPPLPEPIWPWDDRWNEDQLRAYALAALAQRKPLTEKQIIGISNTWRGFMRDGPVSVYVARAVEAAHGIKGPE